MGLRQPESCFNVMEELADNGEPQKNVSVLKDRISLFATAIFWVSIQIITDVFRGTLKLYGFFLFLFLIYFVIQQILERIANQPFNFKKLLKKMSLPVIALLIGYYLENLTNVVSASFPDNIFFSKILSFLIGISTLILVMFIFQIIEKDSKT